MGFEQRGSNYCHRDIELLPQFSPHRVEVRLSQFTFATRELPKVSVPLVRGAQTDKHLAIAFNYCGDHPSQRFVTGQHQCHLVESECIARICW